MNLRILCLSGGGVTINVSIVTIDEPFYVHKMVRRLLEISPDSIRYNCMVIVPSQPKNLSLLDFVLYQYELFGLSQFTKLLALYCRNKILDSISDKELSLRKVAKKRDIPILKVDSLKDPDLIASLKSFSLDIILSIASSRIFGKELLSVPKIACLNVHAGKLPKYRGVNPSFWALLNQEEQSAVSVHYMNEKIDDGDLIAQDVFEIKNMRSLNEVYQKILDTAPRTVLNSLQDVEKGKINIIKNDASAATYYSFPQKEDGRKFRAMGLKFI